MFLGLNQAWAIPTPVEKLNLASLERSWPTLILKIDVKNLVGPQDAGKLTNEQLKSRVDAANEVWTQCAIQFVPRVVQNIEAQALNVPYRPQSSEDLSKIAATLNPNGFEKALPFTIAGPWNFYDKTSGLYLTGLGWVFMNGPKINRIGAMVSADKAFLPKGGPIIAHELAHALSLPHTVEAQNLMGSAGTNTLTHDQCVQARKFAQSSLATYLE